MEFVSVLAVAILLALGPTLLFALLLWWLDRYEKEPIPLLLLAFVWGAVPAILFALIFELGVGLPLKQIIVTDQTREITEAALVAPLVEEAVKAVILVVLFLAYKREFDDALDGIIYGAMVGLGFALVENTLYFTFSAYDNIPDGSAPQIGKMFGLWILRAGLFGLNHSTFTAFTGAALGYARSLKRGALRGLVPAIGLGIAMILHAIHNALTTSVGVLADSGENGGLVLGACLSVLVSDWGALALIVIVALVSSANEGRVIQATLWEEVALGRLTPDEYATLISGRKRWIVRWSVLFASGFRRWRQIGKFLDLSTELAFRKHRMNDGDPIYRNLCARDIAQLRSQIDSLKMMILYGTGNA